MFEKTLKSKLPLVTKSSITMACFTPHRRLRYSPFCLFAVSWYLHSFAEFGVAREPKGVIHTALLSWSVPVFFYGSQLSRNLLEAGGSKPCPEGYWP
jgi:hypothetical protein